MVKDGPLEVYIGGDTTHKSPFDADRFGYFGLIDEIKQLGYGKWSTVAYKVPKTMTMVDIKDDKDVMLMLSYLELRICVLHVYVVGGELSGTQVEEVEGSVGGKQDVGLQAVDHGVGQADGFCEDESEGEYDGCGEDEFEGEYEDGSYIPSTDKEDDTDDDSSLDGFISDDDEYIQARDKFKKSNLRVIIDDLFNGILPNVGVSKTTYGCGDSDYVDSDGDFVSDSTDEEDDRSRIRERHRRRVYDPKCDHKTLKVTPGMRFLDGFQVRDALTNNAIENGWEIHFKRASRTQVEAGCKEPCKWRCYGSFSNTVGAFLLTRVEYEHTCSRNMRNKWMVF